MIHRKAEIALQRLASQFPIVGITGPRQSGKSTLAKMTFPQKNAYHLMTNLLGSISSFLILNSGKDCKGWRSQFRSVAKE